MQVEIETVTLQVGKRRLTFFANEAKQVGEILNHILALKMNIKGQDHFVYSEHPFATRHPDFEFELNDGKAIIRIVEPEPIKLKHEKDIDAEDSANL